MTEHSDTPVRRNRLVHFFSNPVVGIAGAFASVIGVFLSIYFYSQGSKYRGLASYVHPAKATVVKAGEASRLRVLVGAEELRSDVTAAQVAIWNYGNESIRPENVLSPITIRTDPSTPIIEAMMRKQSRDVVNLHIDDSRISEGVLGISWNILERGDGGVIQLVYAGSPQIDIKVSGTIEGQSEVRQLKYAGSIKSAAEQMSKRGQGRLIAWVGLSIGIASWLFIYFLLRPLRWKELRRWDWIRFGNLILPAVLVVGMSVYMLLDLNAPDPPFGF